MKCSESLARYFAPDPNSPRARFTQISAQRLTFAAVDIQLLMVRCPLRACAPVGAPRRFWCEAECD